MTKAIESSIELAGETHRLVWSYEHIVALESELGCPILTLIRRISQAEFSIREMATVVALCADPEISIEDAGQAIVEKGLANTLGELSKGLVSAIEGGEGTRH